jgi:hypothetical protein
MEDPGPAPHRLWDDEIRTLLAQHRAEFAAHQFCKSLDGGAGTAMAARSPNPRFFTRLP